jgi:hypothetical protein
MAMGFVKLIKNAVTGFIDPASINGLESIND